MFKILRFIYKITHPFVKTLWKIFKPHTKGVKGMILYNDEILLVKNIGKDYFMLPGGNLRLWGEDPEACIAREIKEELGITIIPPFELLGTYTSNIEAKRDTIFAYIIQVKSKDFTQQWELDGAKWFSLHTEEPTVSPATKRRIAECISNQRNIINEW